MSATKKRCGELIRLCSGLDFFPKDGTICDLLVGTLQRVAVSDSHAERIINSWLERERKSPTVSDIVNLAGQVPAGSGRKVNRDCELCEGMGFMIVNGHHGFTGATPCPNKCLPPLEDQRKQDVRVTRKFYDAQFVDAPTRRAAFMANRSSNSPIPRITDADIQKLRQVQDSRRSAPEQLRQENK
jgi:hypothetical protein